MPIDVEFQEDGGIHIFGRGVVTTDEFLELRDRINLVESQRPVSYEIADYSKIDGF